MSSKCYILQKDLPNAKSGDEFIWDDKYEVYCKKGILNNIWQRKYVENNPEFFLEKEEPKTEPEELIKAKELLLDNGYEFVKGNKREVKKDWMFRKRMDEIGEKFKVHESKEEKIVISGLSFMPFKITDTNNYIFNSSKLIPEEKYEAICKAIETILNK